MSSSTSNKSTSTKVSQIMTYAVPLDSMSTLTMSDIIKKFNWKDYIELNPDLLLKDEQSALKHWKTIGLKQMRLCNKKQLIANDEFSAELLFMTCYIYYLFVNKLLFNNKITTYKGCSELYYFLPREQIIEKDEQRKYTYHMDRPMLLNNTEYNQHLNYKFWIPPPYKTYFFDEEYHEKYNQQKPLLIIHNKYNTEWYKPPVNFISVSILDGLFEKLHNRFNIVYIRPLNTDTKRGFSIDENIIKPFEDYDLIKQKYSDKITTIEQILTENTESYNQIKLKLYSSCNNFISVQGGTAHFSSLFGGKQIILHKLGQELESKCYNGWYHKMNSNGIEKLVVVSDDNLILDWLDIFE